MWGEGITEQMMEKEGKLVTGLAVTLGQSQVWLVWVCGGEKL